MSKEDDILEQITEKNRILEIFNLIMHKKIIKTEHLYDRLLMRDLDEKLIDKILPEKEKIKLIDKRQHKKEVGYDLYYELSNNQTLKLCFIPLPKKILLINAILRNRKWQNSIKLLDRRN